MFNISNLFSNAKFDSKLIEKAWRESKLEDIIMHYSNFNWNTVSLNDMNNFACGGTILTALLFSGEGKEAYEIAKKYNLFRYHNNDTYVLPLSYLRYEFDELIRFIENNFENLIFVEPNNFSVPQSKIDIYGNYPEFINGKRFAESIIDENKIKDIVKYLFELTFFKNDINAANALGQAFAGAGDDLFSFATYLKCINLCPNNAVYWGTAGIILNNAKLSFVSLYFLSRAIKLDKNNPEWYLRKAATYHNILLRFSDLWQENPNIRSVYAGGLFTQLSKNLHSAQIYVNNNTPKIITNLINELSSAEKFWINEISTKPLMDLINSRGKQ